MGRALGLVAAGLLLVGVHAWIGSGDWMRQAGLQLGTKPGAVSTPSAPRLSVSDLTELGPPRGTR
jgi:hypothetical protein